jgi:hypothetical protein
MGKPMSTEGGRASEEATAQRELHPGGPPAAQGSAQASPVPRRRRHPSARAPRSPNESAAATCSPGCPHRARCSSMPPNEPLRNATLAGAGGARSTGRTESSARYSRPGARPGCGGSAIHATGRGRGRGEAGPRAALDSARAGQWLRRRGARRRRPHRVGRGERRAGDPRRPGGHCHPQKASRARRRSPGRTLGGKRAAGVSGGSEEALAAGPDDSPRFSPDGSRILFKRSTDASPPSTVS